MRKKLATAKTIRVLLPPEIDVTNAEQVCADLCVQVAVAAGTDTVIADMTVTRFCDSAGFRMLLVARDRLAATGVQLEVLVPAESPVMRAIKLIGLDRALKISRSEGDASAGRITGSSQRLYQEVARITPDRRADRNRSDPTPITVM